MLPSNRVLKRIQGEIPHRKHHCGTVGGARLLYKTQYVWNTEASDAQRLVPALRRTTSRVRSRKLRDWQTISLKSRLMAAAVTYAPPARPHLAPLMWRACGSDVTPSRRWRPSTSGCDLDACFVSATHVTWHSLIDGRFESCLRKSRHSIRWPSDHERCFMRVGAARPFSVPCAGTPPENSRCPTDFLIQRVLNTVIFTYGWK